MNILVSQHNVKNISLLIAYVSLYPQQRQQCRILTTYWSCRTLCHFVGSVHPVLDTKTPDAIMSSMEPMTGILPGLYASAARCQRLQQLTQGNYVDFALCVNPQLFKLMEMSV